MVRPFRLVALALVVLAFGAFIYFYERHQPTTDERAERKDKVFATLDRDAVVGIEVVNEHGRFVLAKDGDDWKLTEPLADRANRGAISTLLSTLTGLKAERTLAAADVKLADYGLADPNLAVTLTDEDGTARTLKLGGELPLGTTRAALTADGGDVYLVSKFVADDIDKDLAGWRSTDLTDVLSTDVASLTVRSGDRRVAVARNGSTWTLTEPVSDLADPQRPQDLLGDLNAAQIKEFLDEPGDLSALGLAAPRIEVTVVRSDENAPVQLEFGAERSVDGAQQVACRRGERVFWVDGAAIAHAADLDPSAWRLGTLVKLDTWAVEKFDLAAGGTEAALVREDGVWKAGDVEVDGDLVSRRLRALADLEVASFDLPAPNGDPLATVVATLNDERTIEASFYESGDEGSILATVVGRPGAMSVDAARARDIIVDPVSLTRPKPTPAPTSPPATPTPAATPGGPGPAAGENGQ